MKFSINKSELQNALAVVSKGMATRSTLPILSGIYLEAKGDALLLQATDLEISVKYRVSVLVEEEGAAVVPGKLFESIVKTLPDAAVFFDGHGSSAALSCDNASFSVKTLDPSDFPGFPHVDVSQQIAVPFDQFSSMVRRVARVVSRDESRAVLTGVLVSVEGGTLRMVATDSYRLAVTEAEGPTAAEGFSAVVAGSFMLDIAALPRSEEDVCLGFSENQVVVSYRDVTFINRRIGGNYPNYRQLLPDSHLTRVGIEKDRLASAVKRVAVLGGAGSPVRFDIDVDAGVVVLSGSSQDVGEAQESIPCSGTGQSVAIAFNSSYVLDGLSAVETDMVFLEVQGTMKPGIFRADEGESYLYLIMPVRMA